jgi:hypothetical protein
MAARWGQTSFILGYVIILLALMGVHGASLAIVVRRARARGQGASLWDRMIAVISEDPAGKRWIAHSLQNGPDPPKAAA